MKKENKVITKNDFSRGSIAGNILSMALPMTVAQLINVLYNVVDRMYIGHLPENSALAFTGLGLTFPIITIVIAFANLFGMGGAPLCSIARGAGDKDRAEKIMGNSFSMMVISGIVLMVLCLIFQKPILYLFGASDQTFPYASGYLDIYLLGTVFVMISLGMNSFINSQGFGRIGMGTVLLGAVVNIVLDPIFIFVFQMGVRGAALATIISQFLSALWVLRFLTGRKAIFRLRLKTMRMQGRLLVDICSLGLSGFIMAVTNSLVQIVCNSTLQAYGGDLYVGIMTVINSIREVLTMPVMGITNGAQPVLGYNYGAGKHLRVKSGIKFMTIVCVSYTFIVWGIMMLIPEVFIHLFNSDPEIVRKCVPAMHIYFAGFFMMALQFAGQSTFVALGMSKQAIFFSILRKVVVVVPLTLILPGIFGLGVNGVFLAEPISNYGCAAASFITMMLTVWPKLKKDAKDRTA